MKKSVAKRLCEKDGFSYLLICVIAVFVAMLVFAGLEYTSVLSAVRLQKKQVKAQLDEAATEQAIRYYDAIRQGSRYERYIEEAELEANACRKMGFGNPATEEREVLQGGEVSAVMSRPFVEAAVEDGFGVHVEYDLTVPFRLFGRHISDITSHVVLDSVYQTK